MFLPQVSRKKSSFYVFFIVCPGIVPVVSSRLPDSGEVLSESPRSSLYYG